MSLLLILLHILLSLVSNSLHALIPPLSTFTSNSSHWQSLSDFVPTRNTSYGGIYLQRALSMEYKFIYYGKTSQKTHENVFRIGKSGKHTCDFAGTRYPSMWIHDTDDSFLISISHNERCWDSSIGYISIEKHKLYHVYIEFNETWRFVSLSDGSVTKETVVLKTITDPSLFNTFMNIWISTKHSIAANVTLSDITIKTWNPYATSGSISTSSPTFDPTLRSLQPTLTPTDTPSSEPTLDPTVVPSSNPTVSPSIIPTNEPSTTRISVHPRTRPPTNSPLNEGIAAETTLNPVQNTSAVAAKSHRTFWIIPAGDNYYIWLVIPSCLTLLCLICCALILFWKKNANQKVKTPSMSRNEEDLIFDKIYNKQIQLNIEQQRQHQYYGKHEDILLPDEDSVSSGAAEELFIPQTHTSGSTVTKQPNSVDLNVSLPEYNVYGLQALKGMKSFSFNSKKKYKGRYSPQLQRVSNDIELQHKVSVSIADKHAFVSKALVTHRAAEGYAPHKHVSDSDDDDDDDEEEEEDEDIDEFHDVKPPSTGIYSSENSSKRTRNRLYVDHNPKNILASYSNTSVIYEKASASATANGNEDEVEQLYGLGKNPLLSPGADDNEDVDAEGSHDYKCIEQWLKMCDEIDWRQYLENFRKHKVNDYRLNRLSQKDWKQLIPSIGTRNEFKTLWIECMKNQDKH